MSPTETFLISAGVNLKPPFPTWTVWTLGSEFPSEGTAPDSVGVAPEFVAEGTAEGATTSCAETAAKRPTRPNTMDRCIAMNKLRY
jgi:hypothetical protein